MSHQLPPYISASIPVSPFAVSIPDNVVSEFKTLLKLSKLPPPTYEGKDQRYGVTSAWMRDAKEKWENEYDWRTTEAKLNALPQFVATVGEHKIHFVGVFSHDKDAIPLILLHGWPGSFLEYYPLIEELRKCSAPSFNIIVPSLPGYTFSSSPPLDRDFNILDVVHIMDDLMVGLGLNGYVSIGGDIGSFIARGLSQKAGCRGIHLNMFIPEGRPDEDAQPPEAHELEYMKRTQQWVETGRAYVFQHSTRPSSISHILSSSPLALLGWIGEKFLEWTDVDPTVEQILEMTTLWWLTETLATSLYPYRTLGPQSDEYTSQFRILKPMGYSCFPKELMPQPKRQVEKGGDLLYYKSHQAGGHFPGFEAPQEHSKDIVAFVTLLINRE